MVQTFQTKGKAMRFLNITQLSEKTALSRATLYRMVKAGNFPAPRHFGKSARWREDEVDLWMMQQ